MRHHVLSAAVLSGLLTFVVLQGAEAHTLKQVVQTTIYSSPDVLVGSTQRLASGETIHQARAGYFPTLDFNAGAGRERSRNSSTEDKWKTLDRTELGLTLRQMIFDGFSTSSEVDRNTEKTNADAYQVAALAQDVALESSKSYVEVLCNQRLVQIARRNLASHQRTFKMIQLRMKQGLVRGSELDQARGRLALANADLVASQSRLSDSIANFHRHTGLKPVGLVMPTLPPNTAFPSTWRKAVALAIARNPLMRAASADIREAYAQHRTAMAANYPRLEAVLAANRNRNVDGQEGRSYDYSGMLQLRYNLFRGGADAARQRETAYLSQQAHEIRDRACRQLIESTRLSWTAWNSARRRLPQLYQHMMASKLAVDAYYKQFKLGNRTLLDLLDAESEYFTAQQSLVNAKFGLAFAKLRLLHDMGSLVQYLKVPMPSEAFPVTAPLDVTPPHPEKVVKAPQDLHAQHPAPATPSHTHASVTPSPVAPTHTHVTRSVVPKTHQAKATTPLKTTPHTLAKKTVSPPKKPTAPPLWVPLRTS